MIYSRKTLNKIFGILAFIGFTLIFFTAGASDSSDIAISQIMRNVAIGILLMIPLGITRGK